MLDNPFENFGAEWGGGTEFVDPSRAETPKPATPGSGGGGADIRARLHAICALYRHAGGLDQRLELVELLEEMTIQLAYVFALDLLDAGWRPNEDFVRSDALADLTFLDERLQRPSMPVETL